MPARPFRSLAAAALALGLTGTRVVAAPALVQLIASGPGEVHFTVEVPPLGLEQVAGVAGLDGAVALRLDGYAASGAVGEPEMPSRVIVVAVPPLGDVRVRATGYEEETRQNVVVAPNAVPDRVDSGTPLRRALPEAYARSAAYGTERARLLGVAWLRNQRIARVVIQPVEYDPRAHTARAFRRIDVVVEIGSYLAPGPPAEADDPFEPVYREALINYDQGRTWRRPARVESLRGGTGRELAGLEALAPPGLADTSVFVGRRWLKIAITKSGFYRVKFGQFRRLAPFNDRTTVRLDQLRLFTWPGNPVLPESSYCDTCGYREVAIGEVDDGDGLLNQSDDGFVFYALGPSDWANYYDAAARDTVFINHPYETKNYYFLGIADSLPLPGEPRRIGSRSGHVQETGSEIVPTTFRARSHNELDSPDAYFADSAPIGSSYFWEKWFWRNVALGNSFQQAADALGADTTQLVRLRMRLWGLAGDYIPSTARSGVSLRWNGLSAGNYAWNGFNGFTIDAQLPNLHARSNQVRIDVTVQSNSRGVGVAWFDLFYAHRFAPDNDQLDFETPAVAGTYIYRMEPFTRVSVPRVFDVTDPLTPVEVNGLDYVDAPGGHRLSFESAENGRRRYLVLPDSSIVLVPTSNISSARATSLVNLRSRTQSAQYLVIHFDDFQAAADSLVAWRRYHNGWTAQDVPISAVYDQFSGGRTDPTAIRNFLRTAFYNWNNAQGTLGPSFVTFLGDASFDYKNIATSVPELVPTYENGLEGYGQFTTDDWLLNVDDAQLIVPDFLGGRIPADDPGTAMDIVREKVLQYERSTQLGEYRNRVMFVADDDRQAGGEDPLGWLHVGQTTTLDTSSTPSHLDRVYVYLHTFPSESGDTKPAAKTKIFAEIDGTGVAVFNYIGHGSASKLSDEGVFLDTDADALANAPRLPVFCAASCDVGTFDDPRSTSLGEKLLTKQGGGAAGVISSTAIAHAFENATLNNTIFRTLFSRESSGTYHTTVSQALLAAKLNTDPSSENSQKYQLLGDAAIHPSLPQDWIQLHLTEGSGPDTSSVSQGHTLVFTGEVLDRPGGHVVPLDGVANVLIEDSAPFTRVPPCGSDTSCVRPFYFNDAGSIFRGDVSVTGGHFHGQFVVPLEARPGLMGRARAYVTGRPAGSSIAADGAGDLRVRVAQGSAAATDHSGPRIDLSFKGGGTNVRPDAVLSIALFDSSGILTTGHTPQNGIIVTFDDNTTTRTDVTDKFRYVADSYQAGVVEFALNGTGVPKLSEGPHRITVSAADNLAVGLSAAQHRSRASIDFVLSKAPPLRIRSAYLFPNPTGSRTGRRGGSFVIDTEGEAVNVLVRIYTVSGKLLRVLKAFGGEGQIQIPWDGLDAEGMPLANGVYLFKVHVNPRDESGASDPAQNAEKEGQLVILNP